MTEKTESIRTLFEGVLVEVLGGRPILAKDGSPLMDDQDRVATERPAAADLSVVRAYLKDRQEADAPKDAKAKSPEKGAPQGLLEDFVARNRLPFGGGSKTAQ